MPKASAPPMQDNVQVDNLQRLERILSQYEVSIADAHELAALDGYEIVFLCDDSGSMQLSSIPVEQRRLGVRQPSRWDELQDTVRMVAEVACCFDTDGIDVHFLNRGSVHNVFSCQDPKLEAAFAPPPCGGTPLAARLEEVLLEKDASERPVLVIIATDGEPNEGPARFKQVIERAIKNKHTTYKFQILACTADDDATDWINEFDAMYYEVDATDDYHSERADILKTGRVNKFTRGDWIMKALLGPILKKFDEWDEPAKALPAPAPAVAQFNNLRTAPSPRQQLQPYVVKNDGCCLIM